MKKRICFILALLAVIGCLTACNFTQNMSGAMAGEAEATAKVEEMIQALAEDRVADAKALLHPQKAGAAEDAIAQMRDYLAGRDADSIELTGITVNTSTGTSGKTRQERVNYRVTLTDGGVIYLSAVYLSNNQGIGFASFQLVLGIV